MENNNSSNSSNSNTVWRELFPEYKERMDWISGSVHFWLEYGTGLELVRQH